MPVSQANVEYFFRLLYELFYGTSTAVDFAAFQAFLAHLWLWIVVVGYVGATAALFFIVYATMRVYELRQREKEQYGEIHLAHEDVVSPRWRHIQDLIASVNPSDWRTAIMEADIMLDEMLTRQGYTGAGVGEKLKEVEAADFDSLQDAWEAHKVRNQIAHQGSSFDLSETLARRTIGRYEVVFREFGAI